MAKQELFIDGPLMVHIEESSAEELQSAWERVQNYIAVAVTQRQMAVEQPGPVPAPPTDPRQRIRIRATTGQTALLDGDTADQFLLAANRMPKGCDLVFEGTHIEAWAYEGSQTWQVV